jgi:hypothetical protein
MALMLPLLVGCSDKEPTGPGSDPLIGTWRVTRFEAFGVDAIALGLSMTISFTGAKTYTAQLTDPSGDSCDNGATTCTETGAYTSTSTQITLDPGTDDEVTLAYSIQGITMTFTGNLDGIPVTMVLERQQ